MPGNHQHPTVDTAPPTPDLSGEFPPEERRPDTMTRPTRSNARRTSRPSTPQQPLSESPPLSGTPSASSDSTSDRTVRPTKPLSSRRMSAFAPGDGSIDVRHMGSPAQNNRENSGSASDMPNRRHTLHDDPHPHPSRRPGLGYYANASCMPALSGQHGPEDDHEVLDIHNSSSHSPTPHVSTATERRALLPLSDKAVGDVAQRERGSRKSSSPRPLLARKTSSKNGHEKEEDRHAEDNAGLQLVPAKILSASLRDEDTKHTLTLPVANSPHSLHSSGSDPSQDRQKDHHSHASEKGSPLAHHEEAHHEHDAERHGFASRADEDDRARMEADRRKAQMIQSRASTLSMGGPMGMGIPGDRLSMGVGGTMPAGGGGGSIINGGGGHSYGYTLPGQMPPPPPPQQQQWQPLPPGSQQPHQGQQQQHPQRQLEYHPHPSQPPPSPHFPLQGPPMSQMLARGPPPGQGGFDSMGRNLPPTPTSDHQGGYMAGMEMRPPPSTRPGPAVLQVDLHERQYGTPEMPRGNAVHPHLPPGALTTGPRPANNGVQVKHLPRGERLPLTGYELLASQLANHHRPPIVSRPGPDGKLVPPGEKRQGVTPLPPIYKRFTALNHRMLLTLQDELAELEEQLHRLDTNDTQGRRLAGGGGRGERGDGRGEGHILPASRRQEAGMASDLQWARSQVLQRIGEKVGIYNHLLTTFLTAQTLPCPSQHEVSTYRSYLSQYNPVAEPESRFLDNEWDLLSLSHRKPHQDDEDSEEDWVTSNARPQSRRASLVSLTAAGRRASFLTTARHGFGPANSHGHGSKKAAKLDQSTRFLVLALAAAAAVVAPLLTFMVIPGFVGRMSVVFLVVGGLVGVLVQGGFVHGELIGGEGLGVGNCAVAAGVYGGVMVVLAGVVR